MDSLKSILRICFFTLILLALVVVVLYFAGGLNHLSGVLGGYLVGLVNVLFAFGSITWAFDKPGKTFFLVVLGGMGLRFLFFISVLFLVRSYAHAHLAPFVFSLIGFYLTSQIFEIQYIQKELANRKVIV